MNALSLANSVDEEWAAAESRWDDEGGNLGLGRKQEDFVVPILACTEQAIKWGSHLDAQQHATLVETQRALSNSARAERSLQHRVELATQSQLLREAAEAFADSQQVGQHQ